MPRFYFNLCNGAEFAKDDEGVELADYDAARRKAVESLRGVMAGDLLNGDLNTASFNREGEVRRAPSRPPRTIGG